MDIALASDITLGSALIQGEFQGEYFDPVASQARHMVATSPRQRLSAILLQRRPGTALHSPVTS